MGCGCCISLRSAVYFGASLHTFLGGMQFCLFLWQTILYLVQYYSKRSEQPSLTLISFLILFIGALYFPLGCTIFRGVEREKLSLIRKPMWFFFILKVVEMCLKIYQEGVLFHPGKKVSWEDRLYQGIDLTFSSFYFFLLFFYSRRLQKVMSNSDYFKTPNAEVKVKVNKNKKKLLETA